MNVKAALSLAIDWFAKFWKICSSVVCVTLYS